MDKHNQDEAWLAGQRMVNQRISADQFEQPQAVVRWMGAMQAQDYAQAVWAVGARTTSATLDDVEAALAAGQIVRTWPMRGTLHFVAPETAQWMVETSAPRLIAGAQRRREQLDLNEKILEQCKQLFYDALSSGKSHTRAELMHLLNQAGISTAKQRGYHILWYAAQTGLICMAAMQGKQQTFRLLEEWAGRTSSLTREEALQKLAALYFRSHGPAAIRDFAWWAGIPVGEARASVLAAAPALQRISINGEEYYALESEQPPAPPAPSGSVYLLPGFDEYLLGYKQRSAALPDAYANQISPGNNGMFRAMLVIDSQIVGTWARRVKQSGVTITLDPFEKITKPQENLLAAAQRYSSYLGLPLADLQIE